jgi:hypothetical protein
VGGHLFFGAGWAFVIPTDAMQRSLERDVRIYFWANIGFFAAAWVLARWVGFHVLVLADLVVPSIIYGAFVKRRVRGLARIPAERASSCLLGTWVKRSCGNRSFSVSSPLLSPSSFWPLASSKSAP